MSQIQFYHFQDNGHTHSDAGHGHVYEDGGWYQFEMACGNCATAVDRFKTKWTQNGYANIQNSYSNTQVKGISSGYRKSEETRPKNAIIQWIIRIC